MTLKVRWEIFDKIQAKKGETDKETARGMQISTSMLSQVRNGLRNPGNKFIAAAKKWSGEGFDALFFYEEDLQLQSETNNSKNCQEVVSA